MFKKLYILLSSLYVLISMIVFLKKNVHQLQYDTSTYYRFFFNKK